MTRRARILLASLAAVMAVPGVSRAGATETDVQVDLSVGHDSNPLLLSSEAPPAEASPAAAFTGVSLGSRLTHQWNPRVGFFLAADGSGRFHAASLDEANSSQGRVEAGLATRIFSRGDTRLTAALRASFGAERSTFVDPATGDVYLVESDPNVMTAIPDRFDVNLSAVNLDLRLRTSDRLLFLLDTSLLREDYTQDYAEIPTLEPLDARRWLVRPGVRWSLSAHVRLDVTGEWGGTRYDHLSALEEDGSAATGIRRHYESGGVRAALRVTPSDTWAFSLGLGVTDRHDTHAGYYDTTGDTFFGSLSWNPAASTRLGLRVIQSVYDYERATVDGTLNGDRRGGDTVRMAVTAEHDLVEHLTVFGEGGVSRSNNLDPLYTYDRHWALAGLRFRL